ncbi:M23 family metallopeptidase [Streptomyces antimicrobicus]|uniref:LysM peptidoglycan-binding domain-containing M23 family metallopeptidase n=1 Tax=Streptomyces antimicrobicus TaxID=2883108 RepID=A0ABS8B449_9ACTN|nr:M23 family metallopeptidase [Streptomyces antimicrobicus]MCB5179385.1 LysM peptidoglycan-binding domain-containing M23 family metallopeptidase [Streptomyces antimicrobicus]
MAAKGKHRRPKSSPLFRGFAYAGTSGAALALPLLGAATAQAAPAAAAAPAALPAAVPQAAAQAPAQVPAALAAPAPAAAPSVYTVVPGDCLSTIAHDRGLAGGWEQLYADNREAVGADPDLIHPGLRLHLGGAAAGASTAPEAGASARQSRTAESGAEEAGRSGRSSDGTGSASAAGAADRAVRPAAPKAAAPAPKAPRAAEAGGSVRSGGSTQSGAVSGAGFVAPVSGGISTAYRASGAMWSSGHHTGVDFIAASGTSVKAVGAGTVVTAGWGGAYGNEVVVRHADGRYSQYGHLSRLSVSVGQTVSAGQQLGLSGSTGNSTGPHLHFEIRTGAGYGSDIDPLAYLRSKGVSI